MPNRQLEPVWKALADPTRRRILDSLRAGPHTTGELCRPFKLSRFAVMKHLTILENAGLITIRRQGRERWNHLNAVPIQEIHERWVRPYEAHWAKGLLNLRRQVEGGKREKPMSTDSRTAPGFGVTQVELEIVINGTPARVWKALVEETSAWWLKDFYSSAAARGFIIEPRLGGHAFEDWGNGAGQVWYTVTGLDPERSIMLQGFLSPAFGGPASTLLQLTLKGSGKNTVVQLSDTMFGAVSQDKAAETREGWKMLFEGGLKEYVEEASN